MIVQREVSIRPGLIVVIAEQLGTDGFPEPRLNTQRVEVKTEAEIPAARKRALAMLRKALPRHSGA